MLGSTSADGSSVENAIYETSSLYPLQSIKTKVVDVDATKRQFYKFRGFDSNLHKQNKLSHLQGILQQSLLS